MDLKTILRLPELKAQITEGDVAIEDLEGAWLEACAVEVRPILLYSSTVQ